MFCGTVTSIKTNLPDVHMLNGLAEDGTTNVAECYIQCETLLLQHVQIDCFPEEYYALQTKKTIPKGSELVSLP